VYESDVGYLSDSRRESCPQYDHRLYPTDTGLGFDLLFEIGASSTHSRDDAVTSPALLWILEPPHLQLATLDVGLAREVLRVEKENACIPDHDMVDVGSVVSCSVVANEPAFASKRSKGVGGSTLTDAA